ncbi:MAG: UPF0146 family protein [Halobacteria archaeon]|nr:UPF0146 family protein [Halobacteria archaeon]
MERIAEFIESKYTGKVVEVGVGRQTEVAEYLGSCDGIEVTVTDIDTEAGEKVPEKIEFVADDVTDPDMRVYDGASVIYSVRPPYELHSALKEIAEAVGTDLLVVPLADETPRHGFELLNYEGVVIYRYSS